MNKYWWVLLFATVYAVVLWALNRVPHVQVKYIGWMLLHGVTINDRHADIEIGRLRLSIRIFRKTELTRWIHIEFSDVDIALKHKTKKVVTTNEPPNVDDLVHLLGNLVIPRGVWRYLLRFKLVNQVVIHVFRSRVLAPNHPQLLIEYLRVANIWLNDTRFRFSVYFLDGFYRNAEGAAEVAENLWWRRWLDRRFANHAKLALFRSLELSIEALVIARCDLKHPNKIVLALLDFNLNVSLAKLHLELDQLDLDGVRSKKHPKGEEAVGPDGQPVPHQHRKLPMLTSDHNQLLAFLKGAKFKIDDVQVLYGDFEFLLVDFTTAVNPTQFGEIPVSKGATRLQLLVYLTALKAFHCRSQCVDIPSIAYNSNGDVVDFYNSVAAFANHTPAKINIELSLTVLQPKFDVFYDQYEHMLRTDEKHLSEEIVHAQHDQLPGSTPPRSPTSEKPPHHPHHIPDWVHRLLGSLDSVLLKFVVVDLIGNIHLPVPGVDKTTKFNRALTENLVAHVKILLIVHRIYTRDFKNITLPSIVSKNRLYLVFLVKNWQMDALKNSFHLPKLNLLTTTDLQLLKLLFKLQLKAIRMRSVNDVFFRIVRHIRNQKIEHYNRKYGHLANNQQHPQLPLTPHQKPVSYVEGFQTRYWLLFEKLPQWVLRLTMQIDSFQADILCKDGLPHHAVFDEALQREIDLGDFKRGMLIRIDNIDVYLSRHRHAMSTRIKLIQAFTLLEFSNEFIVDFDDVAEYQGLDLEFTDALSIDLTALMILDLIGKELQKIKRVFQVQDLKLTSNAPSGHSHDGPHTDPVGGAALAATADQWKLVVFEVDARIDMFFVWCACYARLLLKVFLPTVKREVLKEAVGAILGHKRVVKLDLDIGLVLSVIRLPNTVDVMVELDHIRGDNFMVMPQLKFDYIRLYAVHPMTKYWTRVLVMTGEPIIKWRKGPLAAQLLYDILAELIRIVVPNQYAMFTIIDNLITFFKAIKQVKHNFNTQLTDINDYVRLMPRAKHGKHIPNIDISAKLFGVVIEHDPFEVELLMIYELGRVEQIDRIRKLKFFEVYGALLLAAGGDLLRLTLQQLDSAPALPSVSAIDEKITLSDEPAPTQLGRSRTGTTLSRSGGASGGKPGRLKTFFKKVFQETGHFRDRILRLRQRDIPLGDVYDKIPEHLNRTSERTVAEAKARLNQEIGSLWIERYRSFRRNKVEEADFERRRLFGEDKVLKVMTDKHDILDTPEGPPLFRAVFHQLDWAIGPARIDSVDEFLYTWAKGQPLVDYLILLPLYIELRALLFSVQLVDYPLPLICFPELTQRPPKPPTMVLKGNLVINEKLVTRVEEMRHIFVPFSPAAPRGDNVDVFYLAFIPRTLQPIKFCMDLRWDINTDRPCIFGWLKSVSPAVLAAAQALDNFSKPPVDLLPLGWWDKFGLIMHGRLNFYIPNELALHIRLGNSPYALLGKNLGFVFSWRNNVTFKIFDSQVRQELLRLDLEDFVLAVPNYHEVGRQTELRDEPYLVVDITDNRYLKVVVRLASVDRVRWTFGMIYERNVDHLDELGDHKKRTSAFMPHYNVLVGNPQFCGDRDSYVNFRLDYIHMAFSVVCKLPEQPEKLFSNGYFTPLAFLYFYYWWHLIHRGISLPVRQGKLFANIGVHKKKIHVKMSKHIYTVKYLLTFNPMKISHMYMHPLDLLHQLRTQFTGLKARFETCVIDLHQRKELIPYVHEELCVNNKVPHLKMNKGEINGDLVDLRIQTATFNNPLMEGFQMSMRGPDAASFDNFMAANPHFLYSLKYTHFTRPPMSHEDWIRHKVHVYDNDYLWIDLDDFVELEFLMPLEPDPDIVLLLFAFSPKLLYFREFSLNKEGPYPFGNEPLHKCTIGQENPGLTQAHYLEERVSQLKEELKHASTETDRQILNEKIDVVELVWELISGHFVLRSQLRRSSTLSQRLDHLSDELTRVRSTPLLVYSLHILEAELEQALHLDAEAQKFRNRFIVHNMRLKWNNQVRNNFKTYLEQVAERKLAVYYMTRKAVDYVELILKEKRKELDEEQREMLGLERANLMLKHDRRRYGDKRSHRAAKEPSYKPDDFLNAQDVVDRFYDGLTKLVLRKLEIEDKYLVKFIHPQIQLRSERENDLALIVTTRDLQIRILSVVNRLNDSLSSIAGDTDTEADGGDDDDASVASTTGVSTVLKVQLPLALAQALARLPLRAELTGNEVDNQGDPVVTDDDVTNIYEYRYGVLLEDYQVFVFRKHEIHSPLAGYALLFLERHSLWPPWLHVELFYDPLWVQNQLVIERNSLGIVYTKPNGMYLEHTHPRQENKCDIIEVQLAKIVLNATLQQYSTIYHVVTNLLIHSKDSHDDVINWLDKMVLLTDPRTFIGLNKWVVDLQNLIRDLRKLLIELDYEGQLHRTQRDYVRLTYFLIHQQIELYAIVRGISMANVGNQEAQADRKPKNHQVWNIMVDQIIWHVLGPQRDPMVDIALHNLLFLKWDAYDGSKANKVEVALLQGFNLLKGVTYPDMISPIQEGGDPLKPLVSVQWRKLLPVGGIPIIENADVKIQPLRVQLDMKTAKFLHLYMFPDDDSLSDDSDPWSLGPLLEEHLLALVRSPVAYLPAPEEHEGHSLKLPLKPLRHLFKRHSTHGDGSPPGGSLLPSELLRASSTLLRKPGKFHRKVGEIPAEGENDDVQEIFDRSLRYMLIVDIDVADFTLVVSFDPPKHLKILDVHNLKLLIPRLQYRDKVWLLEDIVLQVRKDVIKVLLAHTGKILGNKLKPRHRKRLSEPLKMISDYSLFMTVNDLQEDGRLRDLLKTTTHNHPHMKPKVVYHKHRPHLPLERQELLLPLTTGLEKVLQEIADEHDNDDDNTVRPYVPATKKKPTFVESGYDM